MRLLIIKTIWALMLKASLDLDSIRLVYKEDSSKNLLLLFFFFFFIFPFNLHLCSASSQDFTQIAHSEVFFTFVDWNSMYNVIFISPFQLYNELLGSVFLQPQQLQKSDIVMESYAKALGKLWFWKVDVLLLQHKDVLFWCSMCLGSELFHGLL